MEENQMEEQEPPLNLISGDAHFANWQELVPVSAISSSHIKIHSETITKQNGNLSLKLAKRMKKSEATEINGGGRIIRAAGRKDRHSKVCTARGTRDRRVRLSPNTAIQFYDVQDRLGYDRPSKAIDWLMKEARAAIDALDEPPPAAAGNVHFVPASSVGNSNYDPGNGEIQPEDVVSLSEGNFGFFSNNVAGYSGGLECFPAAPLTTHVGTFDANLEMARILTWNYGNYSPPPHHFSGHSFLGQAQFVSQREPLQSSYSRITNYNRASTCRIPGFGFSSEELPGFTTPEENEMDNNDIPDSGELSSTASFLNYEE